ncbi:MAG: hypothetical protein A2868_03485 [Candidatus Levybacteria bacterium RIFCSPHIGHO2_01_FULL_40_15b]|nr:MAG: hypothetical protein A2868_03485 [Candidatus Levybacteria bacterium RIFCSPHIGHO2_01_FULL_40_15b]
MADLTIIMLTPNLVPKKWVEFHKQKLLEAAGDNPIITISKEPLDWGVKNLIQTEYGLSNLYRQILRGAKEADTPLVAIAEDDTLYPKQHFQFRPIQPGYYYNLNRWHMFTWKNSYYFQGRPFYFYKPRPANGLLISTRELMVESLESRLATSPDLENPYLRHELGTVDRILNYDKVPWRSFYTREPVLCFDHIYSVGDLAKRRKKRPWPIAAYDIPVWGRAEEIVKKFQ